MNKKDLTNNEFLVLGLVAEMPRHGYELERVIDKREMREWTQIGFSSIYFVLGKLESQGLIKAETPKTAKAKKRYKMTKTGHKALVSKTMSCLKVFHPNSSSLLMGMIHWPVLTKEQALEGLETRCRSVSQELERFKEMHFEQQPMPDFMDSMFEFSIEQLKSEAKWIAKTLAYMQSKPWDD